MTAIHIAKIAVLLILFGTITLIIYLGGNYNLRPFKTRADVSKYIKRHEQMFGFKPRDIGTMPKEFYSIVCDGGADPENPNITPVIDGVMIWKGVELDDNGGACEVKPTEI